MTSDEKRLLVAIIVAIPLIFTLNTWVFAVMWGWFVVPLGVPALGFWHSAGIQAVITWPLRMMARRADTEKPTPFVERGSNILALGLGQPLLMLGLGWAIQAMMP